MNQVKENLIYQMGQCLSLNSYEHANFAFRQVVFSKLKHEDLSEMHHFMDGFLKRLQSKKLEEFNNKFISFDPADAIMELKEYGPDEITEENFKRLLISRDSKPFVIRGFLKDSEAVKKWNLYFFKKHYSKQKVIYDVIENNATLESGIEGTLEEVIGTIQSKSSKQKYLHNANDIFRCNRELISDLHPQKIASLFKGCKNGVIQLFFGGPKTGTGWHSGTDSNAFIMLHGKKKWFFMHPEYSYVLTPDCQDVKVPKSCIPWYQPVDYLEEHYPLYLRTPKYMVDLEPGDMAVFKAWWWHAITNLTDTSIAAVTRWIEFEKGSSETIQPAYPLQEYIAKSDKEYIDYGFKVQNEIRIGELISDDVLKKTYTKSFIPAQDEQKGKG